MLVLFIHFVDHAWMRIATHLGIWFALFSPLETIMSLFCLVALANRDIFAHARTMLDILWNTIMRLTICIVCFAIRLCDGLLIHAGSLACVCSLLEHVRTTPEGSWG